MSTKLIKSILSIFSIALLAVSFNANAALLISDLDLNNLSFEVDGITPPTTTGTSNGIDFTLSGSYYTTFSNTTGSQTYNGLTGGYDDLHLGATFTIIFDQAIDYLLVAISNDNNIDTGLGFGLTPSDFSGSLVLDGSKVLFTSSIGGLVLYEFASPITSLTHTNVGISDGFNVSFFAGTLSSVPLPAALWLFGPALLGFMGFRRRALNA